MFLNIFKIRDNITIVKDALEQDRELELIGESSNMLHKDNKFTIELYYKKTNGETEIDWLKYFSSFLDIDKDITSKFTTPFGVLLIYCDAYSYGISFGKSFSYLLPFCDMDFGLDMASKMLTSENVISKSSKFFKLTKSKGITVFNVDSLISFEFGEANEYLFGKLIFENELKSIEEFIEKGKNVGHFGVSAKFSVDTTPDKLIEFIYELHNIYINSSLKIIIPRLNMIDSKKQKELIETLNKSLFDAVINEKVSVSVGFYSIIGTDIIINSDTRYILYHGHKKMEFSELNILNIKEFIIKNSIKFIDDIKVKIVVSGSKEPVKLMELLDYTETLNNNNYCLFNGKWACFNKTYIDFIENQIREVNKIIVYDSNFDVDDDELLKFRALHPLKFKKVKYREFVYNHYLVDKMKMKDLDRKRPQKTHKIVEFADLYDPKLQQLIHVKIGEVGLLSDCIKQSLYATKLLNDDRKIIKQLTGKESINYITLLLCFEHHGFITSSSVDLNLIKSIIFKANIVDWYTELQQRGFSPRIYVSKHINKLKFD